MTLSVQCERDEDGRWLAKMPGAIAYGETIEEAMAKAEALTLQTATRELGSDEKCCAGLPRHHGSIPAK